MARQSQCVPPSATMLHCNRAAGGARLVAVLLQDVIEGLEVERVAVGERAVHVKQHRLDLAQVRQRPVLRRLGHGQAARDLHALCAARTHSLTAHCGTVLCVPQPCANSLDLWGTLSWFMSWFMFMPADPAAALWPPTACSLAPSEAAHHMPCCGPASSKFRLRLPRPRDPLHLLLEQTAARGLLHTGAALGTADAFLEPDCRKVHLLTKLRRGGGQRCSAGRRLLNDGWSSCQHDVAALMDPGSTTCKRGAHPAQWAQERANGDMGIKRFPFSGKFAGLLPPCRSSQHLNRHTVADAHLRITITSCCRYL